MLLLQSSQFFGRIYSFHEKVGVGAGSTTQDIQRNTLIAILTYYYTFQIAIVESFYYGGYVGRIEVSSMIVAKSLPITFTSEVCTAQYLL